MYVYNLNTGYAVVNIYKSTKNTDFYYRDALLRAKLEMPKFRDFG